MPSDAWKEASWPVASARDLIFFLAFLFFFFLFLPSFSFHFFFSRLFGLPFAPFFRLFPIIHQSHHNHHNHHNLLRLCVSLFCRLPTHPGSFSPLEKVLTHLSFSTDIIIAIIILSPLHHLPLANFFFGWALCLYRRHQILAPAIALSD
ncbi:hypothetical protein M431DRAFT_195352 [Trichoderma harzianum CBS 226.95]|uniref:Uncharacterized protein n=1 Tax=Trichoderma harzianum CBS 226.95 TaxID=983964 RepID=A0A2T4AUJ7_TRIHA|nr:hypothetical protein M431DRAFT_195352 [Trichoderma harzianum CBS 226.95]PTB60742.1 hypothetical protein M431DRAFT_195352 [Trichoderma harzianum CBS 226.95]